jgi:hypothetical protein
MFIDNENLLVKAKFYAQLWKSRWHNFFIKLWNNPLIQDLLNTDCPQATKVIGEPNGFAYIIEVISEHVFEKVFYGCFNLPQIEIKTTTGDTRKASNIRLFTKKGCF